MSQNALTNFFQENRRLGELARPLSRGSLAVGLAAIGLSLVLGLARGDRLAYFLHAYLVSYASLLGITLGALFFVTLQHLIGATWSVTIRRLAEIVAANMPLMAVLSLPIFASLLSGNDALYSWNNAETVSANAMLVKKQAYLNAPFFCIRLGVYLAIWCALAHYYFSRSVRQDTTGDPELSDAMRGVSAPTMIVFALTVTFASFDLLMSLTPLWYSTIFGVYIFAGGIVGFLALLILLSLGLQRSGRLTSSVTVEHYHDLGKLLFGFVFFWGYIAFSQYLLIWYANIPEETVWFVTRQTGSWVWVSLILVFGHFFIPFLGLLSRHVKRNPTALGFWAAWMLVMHWVDIEYIVMPSLSPEGVPFHLLDVSCLLGLGALYVFGLTRRAAAPSLLPERDPRLAGSLAFENA